MGVLSGIMGLLKKSPKAIDTGLDLITRGSKQVGQMIYTEQERAEKGIEATKLNLEGAKLHLEFVKQSLNESSVRSYTRRVMAWTLVGLGVFLTVWSLICDLVGRVLQVKYSALGAAILAHAEVAWDKFLAWAPWIGLAVGFYLGVHILRSMGKSKDKE
jgi:hypothetical protein